MKTNMRANQPPSPETKGGDVTATPKADAPAALPGHLIRAFVDAEDMRDVELARMVHDTLGQEVAALLLGLRHLEQANPQDIPSRSRSLYAIAQVLSREVDRIAFEMCPTALVDHGLAQTLTSYLDEWSRLTKIPVAFDVVSVAAASLPRNIELGIFLIVSAALRASSRHGSSTRVSVILQRQGDALSVVIEDNAVTAKAPGDIAAGAEPAIIAGRTAVLGGTLSIERRPGGGTTTVVRVPISASPSS